MRLRGVAHLDQCSKAARPSLTRVLAQSWPRRARDRRSPSSPDAEIAADPGLEAPMLRNEAIRRSAEATACGTSTKWRKQRHATSEKISRWKRKT